MRLDVVIFVIAAGLTLCSSQHVDNVTLTCNGDRIEQILFNKTYLMGLTSSPLAGLYIVAETNATMQDGCKFENRSDDFRYQVASHTLMNCSHMVGAMDGVASQAFLVQLFTVTTGLVSFDGVYQWRFTCNRVENYTITSGKIMSYARSFNGSNNVLGGYSNKIEFFPDNNYTTPFNPSQISYAENATVYTQLSVDVPPTTIIEVEECIVRNVISGASNPLITNKCPISGSPLNPVGTYISNSVARLTFLTKMDTPNDMDFLNEKFQVVCNVTICDSLDSTQSCSRATCARRRRSTSSGNKQSVIVTAAFKVVSPCRKKGCAQSCHIENYREAVCGCREGFTLHEDGRNCIQNHESTEVESNPQKAETRDGALPSEPVPLPHPKHSHSNYHKPTDNKPKTPLSPPQPNKVPSGRKGPPQDQNSIPPSQETFSAPDLQSIMLFSTFALSALLCLFLVVLLFRKCRSRQKTVAVDEIKFARN